MATGTHRPADLTRILRVLQRLVAEKQPLEKPHVTAEEMNQLARKLTPTLALAALLAFRWDREYQASFYSRAVRCVTSHS